MRAETNIPICRCGRPVKFSNQTRCEDCWNEPRVIGKWANGSPRVTGVLASSRAFVASAFPWADQSIHRPLRQRIKLGQLLGDCQEQT